MYHTYIIKSSKSERYYIGSTSNVEKRLKYHNLGYNTSTRNKGPWELVYSENFLSKKDALIRERFIKAQKNRSFYERLIHGT